MMIPVTILQVTGCDEQYENKTGKARETIQRRKPEPGRRLQTNHRTVQGTTEEIKVRFVIQNL